jgi:hypothetical protein
MDNLKEALLDYLVAEDAKQLQIALDNMASAIKKDIISTIEETIKEAKETSAPDLQAKNFNFLKAQNAAGNLLNALNGGAAKDELETFAI